MNTPLSVTSRQAKTVPSVKLPTIRELERLYHEQGKQSVITRFPSRCGLKCGGFPADSSDLVPLRLTRF